MDTLHTNNPIALAAFINETIFNCSSMQPDELAEPSVPFYGENRKNILFIVHDPAVDFFSNPAESAFLKTLQALSLQLDDVAVYNMTHNDMPLEKIQNLFHPAYIVLLSDAVGIFPELRLSKNEPVRIQDSWIMDTHSFEQMLIQPALKKTFWPALKNMLSTHE